MTYEHVQEFDRPLVVYLEAASDILRHDRPNLAPFARNALRDLIPSVLAAFDHASKIMLPDDELDDDQLEDPDFVIVSDVAYQLATLIRELVPETPDGDLEW